MRMLKYHNRTLVALQSVKHIQETMRFALDEYLFKVQGSNKAMSN